MPKLWRTVATELQKLSWLRTTPNGALHPLLETNVPGHLLWCMWNEARASMPQVSYCAGPNQANMYQM